MTKAKTTKKKKEVIDIPVEELSDAKINSVVETLQDPQTHVIALLQRYLIADQTKLVQFSMMNVEGFEFPSIVNYVESIANSVFENEHKYLLIANDLADKLIQQNEMILRNGCGTWWIVNVDENNALVNNPALLAIVNEVLGVK